MWRIRLLGLITMVGLTALVVALLVNSRSAAASREQAASWQAHTITVLRDGRGLSSALQDAEIGQRGYLLTGNPVYLTMAATAERRAPPLLSSLRELTRDNPRQRISLADLQRLLALRRAQIDSALSLTREGRREAALADVRTGGGLRTMNAYRAVLAAVLVEENRLLAERSLRAASLSRKTDRYLLGISAVGALVLVVALVSLIAALRALNRARLGELESQAARRIRLSEERLKLVQAAGEVGGFDVDLLTGDAICSPELFAQFGLPDDTPLTRSVVERAIYPEDREEAVKSAERAIATGGGYDHECRIVRPDGTVRWLSVRARPVADDGAATRYVGVTLDTTDRKTAEAELAEAKAAAESANEAKSQFLANMSHELRTPLNAVIGYSEMLREEAEDMNAPELLPDLDKIHRAGKSLLSLVNDLLDLAKIEAGKMDLYVEEFSVAEMIDDVLATVKPLVDKNENTLALDMPAELGSMRADLTKVRQILLNLLSNASKFTTGGRISVGVRRRTAADGDRAVFEVRDAGVGLAPEQLDRLFQAFQQADASTTRNYGGTGLGLALTRRLCQMMGGDVTVTSSAGEGSVFTVALPWIVTAPEQEEAEAVAGAERVDEASGLAVLVVDDDPPIHDLVRRFLAKEGLRAVIATDAESAIAQARSIRPLAITLDVMMPGADGWSVLSMLKADPETADIPVIMLTMVNDRSLGYALGASEYLTKPIDRERLHAILARYLSQTPGPVLIVEDDAATRELMRRTLEGHGRPVSEAGNGRLALEAIERARPSLILLDLLMPEMDGFEFLYALRANDAWRDIPVIVVTSKDLSADERRRLSGKVDSVLQKGALGREDLLREVAGLAAACAKPAGPATVERPGRERASASQMTAGVNE